MIYSSGDYNNIFYYIQMAEYISETGEIILLTSHNITPKPISLIFTEQKNKTNIVKQSVQK